MKVENYNLAFAKRLNEILDEQNIPPLNNGRVQTIASMFLISNTAASKWVNGISIPAKKRMKDISSRFEISYEWLAFGKGSKFTNSNKQEKKITDVKTFPILTFNEASEYEKILPNFVGPTLTLDTQNVSSNSFVIYSTGTAMSVRFPEGTLLIVDPNIETTDGDYVIVKLAKLPESIFRQLFQGKDGRYLYAHDPRYQSHKLTSSDKIIGKVVEARSQL